MEQRLDMYKANPEAIKAMMALEGAIGKLGLEQSLMELVRLRASQINGCAFCVDMHSADARKHGETERRLYTLSVWRETTFFTLREQAALAWTEALTRVADTHAPQADYELVKAQFSEAEQVALTLAIGAINTWNRLSIGFQKSVPA